MSGKIKIVLGVLALGALVSVSYLFSGFKTVNSSNSGTATIINGTISNDTCQRDTDQDGLTDCQESYWKSDPKNPDTDGDGFLDGEEVLSGHSPSKAGPNDLLGAGGNVTDHAATLLLGALSAGDLSSTSPNYAGSVQALGSAVIADYQANSQVPPETFILGSDQTSSIISYGFATSNIISKAVGGLSEGFTRVIQTIGDMDIADVPALTKTNPARYTAFTAAIDVQIQSIESSITDLKKLPVPPSMAPSAQNIFTLLRGVQQQYRLLEKIAQDPTQGDFAFQTLGNLTRSKAIDVAEDFVNRLGTAMSR